MIDRENEVFTKVMQAILDEYPDCNVSGEYTRVVDKFPAVTLIMMDNSVLQAASALNKIENAVDVMYEVNIYSNKMIGKKTEAKAIAAIVDETMLKEGFFRTLLQPIANVEDATIYRIIARYNRIETEE